MNRERFLRVLKTRMITRTGYLHHSEWRLLSIHSAFRHNQGLIGRTMNLESSFKNVGN